MDLFLNPRRPFDLLRKVDRFFAAGIILFVVGFLLWPLYLSDRPQARKMALTKVKLLALGCQMYADDFDDHLPIASGWMDAADGKVKDDAVFKAFTPEQGVQGYGFAFRRKLSGYALDSVTDPTNTALVFDSLDLRWNANGDLGLLPQRGRRNGENAIAFADGHARMCKPGDRQIK